MPEELKARISDMRKLEKSLSAAGATFVRELKCVDTYFNQPKGLVLKLVQDNDGTFLSRLCERNGKFELIERTEIDDPDELHRKLSETHGVYRTLKKRRKLFKLGNNTVDLNLIEGVGDFVVLLGESPSEDEIAQLLGEAPEFIRVPFSDL